MTYEFKEGDRVYWAGGGYSPQDSGVIVADEYGSIYTSNTKSRVWVKWDSNGDVLHVLALDIKLVEPEPAPVPTNSFTEEQAIAFLLSKGYRIEKVNKGD